MSNRVELERRLFKVICTWCGVIIRLNNVKESRGMCLKCYSDMLHEHIHPRAQESLPRFASER